VTRRKTPSRKKKPKFTAKTADKHVLYQLSVQATDVEVKFIDRVFKKLRGRPPLTLREDFCGTALLCAEWIRRKGRTATGIDLDADVLAWAVEHNLGPLGEPGDRIRLVQQNVLDPVKGRFDVTVGMNFSYFVFKTRPELRAYFANARRSATREGIFVIDLYGGYESFQAMEEPRKIAGGFTYVWDQSSVDPINNHVVNHIHFEFKDGSKLRKAFTYDWRIWTIPELRELLAEAGFSRSTVYWEDGDEDGEGTGVFRPRTAVDNEAAWVAYIVAEP
jgi:SAM-dependent methyltransferase